MKIEIAPKKTKVEIPDYGTFEISPFGAGAEAEIRIAMRELNELMEDKSFEGIIKREEQGEDVDKDSEEYKNALEHFKKANKKIEEVKDLTVSKLKNVIKGENKDKLFQDFTQEQLMEIYNKAK